MEHIGSAEIYNYNLTIVYIFWTLHMLYMMAGFRKIIGSAARLLLTLMCVFTGGIQAFSHVCIN